MAKATTKSETPEPEEIVNEAELVVEASPESTTDDTTEKTTAKAGKRSAKALAEVDAKLAKEERKETATEEAEKPKQHANPTRTRLERQGKKFREAAQAIEKNKVYNLAEALELATKTNPTKFDASVELHINLNVDPRHADQNLRDSLVLPAGTGKAIRVAVFADGEAAAAQKAGADIAGTDEIIKDLDKGNLNFDILIATPSQMAKLGKYARVLGPRGLMPNPKSGTVTTDVVKAVTEAKAGRVEYRVDSTGIVHLGVGKVSFGAGKLEENVRAIFASIKSNKPNSVKSSYVKSIHIATAMGPSIAVAISEV